MAESKYIFADGRTKLNQNTYRIEAKRIRENLNLKKGEQWEEGKEYTKEQLEYVFDTDFEEAKKNDSFDFQTLSEVREFLKQPRKWQEKRSK